MTFSDGYFVRSFALVTTFACTGLACRSPSARPTPDAAPLASSASVVMPSPTAQPTPTIPASPISPGPVADDAIRWTGETAEVLVVTDAVKREIEAKPAHPNTPVALRQGANNGHLATLASKLPWLSRLVVWSKDVTDLTPLHTLGSLKSLHLNENAVTTLRPLAGYPALESLSVTCGATFADADMTALENISTLRTLDLRGCKTVTSLHGVEHLSDLAAVALMDTGVREIGALSGKGKLKSLSIDRAPLTDLSPIAGLSGLAYLAMRNVYPADFGPLRSLTHLETLVIATDFRDPTVLSRLTELKMLSVGGDRFFDGKGFPPLPKLETLYLSGAAVSDVSPIARSTSLRIIGLEHTSVTSLAPLATLPSVSSITVPPRVSDEEVRALRRALPKARVVRVGRPLPEDPRSPP